MRDCALASLALAAGIGVARADDADFPGAAAASGMLRLATAPPQIGLKPSGAIDPKGSPGFEPPLPPEVPTDPVDSGDVAERIPFAIDALVGSKQPFTPLRASDWRGAREAVRSLYVSREFRPIWTDGLELNSFGRSLLAELRRAGDDGLNLSGLDLDDQSLSAVSAERAAEIEIRLSIAAAVYALEASGARISPRSLSLLPVPKGLVADALQSLVDLTVATDPGTRLQAFNPSQPGYRRLREKLAELAPGRATAFAQAQSIGGDLIRSDAAPVARLHRGRIAAIAPFPSSLDNASRAQRRANIVANMEMWRWQPREYSADRVEINIPDFELTLFRDDRQVDDMRVIVGKPDTPTPIFSNQIRYLLINPIWRVPESIVRREMLPKAGGDVSYLQEHGFNVKRIGGQIFVEQPPGEANALGRLLFMFPNEYSVYLHDTPAHALFRNPDRAYSHGCIRVEAPLRLASEIMGGEARGWPETRIENLYGASERWVFLPSPLPIHIEYFTEYVDDRGNLQERADIYGLTAKVAAGLSNVGQD